MIALITTLCLFTTVKTDVSGLQVQTVRSGNNVVIKCDENITKDSETHNLAWYKQSLGKVPESVMRLLGQGRTPRFNSNFKDGRFTVDKNVFDLNINGIKEEDAGTYFCGKVKANVVEFGSGTYLFFQAEKIHRPLTEMVIKTGESVTLQCSVQSLTSNCSGEHSVYWLRHGSGESHPGIIYTHGNRSDECKKSSETDSPTQSCVYKLPKRNLSLSDAGTYYCAVAACGRILFGNQTKVKVQENNNNNSGIVITLTILNVISVMVIMVLIGFLLKSQRNGATNDHPSHTDQAEDTEVLNYAALDFSKKNSSSRKQKESQSMYSQLILGDPEPLPGQFGDIIPPAGPRTTLESRPSWPCPVNLQEKVARGHPNLMPEPPQLAPFNVGSSSYTLRSSWMTVLLIM
ncbi:uncharacterized protein LOC118826063 [Colossoma macropomum]|uniref:uncharacterized protein LOC118826063 n=1 Tax=Colossoma macropomum TaxID=42526 RepID=UPI0018650CF7|nr:uncharacterized protein LOC118826063 [Colossoma macropomum]